MLNRGAVILRPAQPFIDWASQLDDSGLEPSLEGEKSVYLIPEYEDDVEAMEILSQCYDILFEMELEAWHTDDAAWPRDRTFKMFRDWFVIELHSVVEDLCGYPILDDENL